MCHESVKQRSQNEIRDEFEALPWHDSGLVGLSIKERADHLGDHVIAWVKWLIWSNPLTEASGNVSFLDCAIVQGAIDLDWKRRCGNAMSCGFCETEPDFHVERASLKLDPEDLRGYLRFGIGLCSPGGEIVFIAKDFKTDPPATELLALRARAKAMQRRLQSDQS